MLLDFLLIFIFQIIYTINYCSGRVCDYSAQSVLCNSQQLQSPAQRCIDYEKTIKSEKDKQGLLNKLNDRRNKVASGEIRSFPTSSNMMKLEWSESLEQLAQRWADQCFYHSTIDCRDPCLIVDKKKESMGQNIATVYGEALGLSPLVLADVWYMELLQANVSVISQYIPSSQTESPHYDYFTQLVWAESNYVGCGSVKFKELKKDNTGSNRTVNRLVCNFSPGGNRHHEPVYTEGLPCSHCPKSSTCDTEYTSLCKTHFLKEDTFTTVNISESYTVLKTENNTMEYMQEIFSFDPNPDEENFTPYNYFSNFFQVTKEHITVSTANSSSCKDVLAIEDFVELLKKRLSNDPMFKQLLISTTYTQTGENTYTDPSVAAFVSRLYSKKQPVTTTTSSDNGYINSTLLANLVEAVIFRSGDKIPETEATEPNVPTVSVYPIKVQAELAEIKLNKDFTGHYFFPEDETEESNTETTESYDDVSSFPVSDIVLEIDDIRRERTTKDFLEEILESESASGNDLIKIKRREVIESTYNNNKYKIHAKKAEETFNNPEIRYEDLLKKIAFDLKVLELNEHFHCSRNYSTKSLFTAHILFIFIMSTMV